VDRLVLLLGILRSACRGQADLVLENVALRHQLGVLMRGRPPTEGNGSGSLFWVVLRRLCARWSEVLVFVKPETVVRWHRAGFGLYWNWLSRRGRRGRPTVAAEVRWLVRPLATENPTWGAPRVHGAMRMLGLDVSERTVSRLMSRRAPKPAQRWGTSCATTATCVALNPSPPLPRSPTADSPAASLRRPPETPVRTWWRH
jgi:putative transposase